VLLNQHPPGSRMRDLCDASMRRILRSLRANSGRYPVAPVRYFAFGLVLDLLRILGGPEAAEKLLELVLESGTGIKPNVRREALIPRHADPLHELGFGLSVRRFATLNYDLEIERFFHDTAFELPTPIDGRVLPEDDPAVRVGPLGGRTRDFVLNEHNVTELFDFATGDNAYFFEVIHLHGRATDDEPILVTERDYQETYVREGGTRNTFHEAREAAFGGNPILFVGVGMSESDVLRPLREFVAGPLRRNRAVIALLPADGTRAANDSFAMDQFVKHGVSVVRYGDDGTDCGGQPWLAIVLKAITALRDEMPELAKRSPRGRMALPGRVEALTGARIDRRAGLEFELRILREIGLLCKGFAADASAENTWEFFQHVAPAALGRVRVSIQTMALTRKLVAIRQNWHGWWRDWQQVPRNRGDFVRDAVRRDAQSLDPIWSRHRVVDHEPTPPALWDTDGLTHNAAKGRRCLIVAAPRGTGKGTLYSHLTQTWDLSRQAGIRYLGQFFTTFDFTCEISSVWDAMPLFLLAPRHFPLLQDEKVWDELREQYGVSREKFQERSRRERLDFALRIAHERARRAGKDCLDGRNVRLLIGFNMFDVLVNEHAGPRQGEIADIFDILLSDEHDEVPLDLFLIVRETNLPECFRVRRGRRARPDRMLSVLLPAGSPDPRQLEFILGTLRRSRANLNYPVRDQLTTHWLQTVGSRVTPSAKHFLYVLPPSDPMSFHPSELCRKVAYHLTKELAERAGAAASPALLHDFFQQQLGSNRHAYALLMKIVAHILEMGQRERRERFDALLGALEVMPRRTGPGISDKFYEIVLDFWFQHPGESRLGHSRDPVLHELLIRHIAVIGMPVSVRVLVRCPQIRDRADKLVPPIEELPMDTNEQREMKRRRARVRLVMRAVNVLVKRQLVIAIEGDPDGPGGMRWNRYQVHRAIQLHVYRRLGSENYELGDSHVIGPSLYSAQVRQLPQLSSLAYSFVYELVDQLSSYPRLFEYPRNPLNDDEMQTLSQCLRCALGVMRTLFSLGVVTRLADSDGLPARSAVQMGYLEHHRLVIRWMLKFAAWIDGRKTFMWPPFHRDETIWLFNECGIFSYAQGRCDDALALFDQALKLQAKIDGPAGGPMRRRILLNYGLNAVDRGRLAIAKRAFDEVHRIDHDDPVHGPLASGYLGIVEHLSGHLDAARARYAKAIKALTRNGRLRAVALLKQHSGFLYMHLGQFEDARREFRDSLQLAEAGGYADFAHYARIAEAKAHVRDRSMPRSFDSALRRLEAAQEYADRMDIPRMSIETLLFQGEILIEQGEAALAGELITRAIQMANLHGLMFRRIFAMELLSRAYTMRHDAVGAARLRAEAQRSARSLGYHLSVFRINREVL
jgi:tetratricopeptide (TPR) repeat protein